MESHDELLARYDGVARLLKGIILQGKKIAVVTHIDADGLTSGSIVFKALKRRGANVLVRTVPDLDPKRIGELADEKYDFYLFTDLGSTLLNELSTAFDGKFLAVDHHQIPDEDAKSPFTVNAWQFGYNGGTEACSGTMAYFLASALDGRNRDLSPLAVVGAVADRQDTGPGRSLIGLNKRALEDAQSAGLVTVTNDLMFHGRETRPVHEAIALTSTPHIKGLSGSRDATLAALVNAGVSLKEGGRWRTLSELSGDEKKRVMDVLVSFLAPSGSGDEVISQLIGEVYTLEQEDSFTPMRDAREFATMLNACGRMDQAGVGISVCIGDRGDSLKEAMGVLQEYRQNINKSLQGVLNEVGRVEVRDGAAMVKGDGLVDERILGPVASILASTESMKDKVIIARTRSGEEQLKFSCRVGDSFGRDVNLGVIMREAATLMGGVGGGHTMAAGAKIPFGRGDDFLKIVLEKTAV
ncbi:MAG: DHH family phosphoesterase [Thaumarchaeota archaeon]|nr:DHH family phosphoesterase [Nitrososphaerota archaeon]